jgi:hypothetical protein
MLRKTQLTRDADIQLIAYGAATSDGRTARNAIAGSINKQIYTLRVDNGAARKIEVVQQGLSLPGEAVPVSPAPR